MATETAMHLIHPAAQRLHESALAERRALARALAIEADWRYHDGPEWAARYWAAFGDLQAVSTTAGDDATAIAVAGRADWPVLDERHAGQARAIFRALLASLNPDVQPQAAVDTRANHWPLVLRAYRGGDLAGLRTQLSAVRRLSFSPALPVCVVALRAEHRRLCHARGAADRRLAELSQTFPFCVRDNLADADWIRRQRLALRQIRVMTAPPIARPAGRAHHAGLREQVS